MMQLFHILSISFFGVLREDFGVMSILCDKRKLG